MLEPPKKERKTYAAPALEKGLDILELLAAEGEPLTNADIASRLGRSVGEIFRMIVVLKQRGYVASGADDRYALTMKMFQVSSQVAPLKRLNAVATSVMHDLAIATQQSCHLVVYTDGRGVIVAQESSPSPRGFTVRLGAEAPLFETCSGHLFLAFADDTARDKMIAEQPKPAPKRPSKAALQRMITRVQKQGYESIKSGQVAGVQDIGYPVFDHAGKMQAALLIPFLHHIDGSEEVSFEDCRARLADAASAISRGLGFTGESE